VRGQDDRKRERHAMDGVWLPAGEENPGARGLPDSRHTHGPGIAKGEAFSPLARRRSPEVNRTAMSTRRKRIKPIPNPDPTVMATTRHRGRVGLRPTQPNRLPIADPLSASRRWSGRGGDAAVAMAERLAGAADGRHDPLRVIKKQNRLPREPV